MNTVDKSSWVKFESKEDNVGRFTFAPLEKGMGVTIGNSLRRVLLSSLSGFAVTKVSVVGVQHEFSSIPNVVEDTLDVISNLKSLVFTSSNFEEKTFTLSGKGKGVLKASDIVLNGFTSIINSDAHILEMSAGANVTVEITVSYGTGYQLATPDSDLNSINTDSSFSPVIKVNHTVENIRVGKEMGVRFFSIGCLY